MRLEIEAPKWLLLRLCTCRSYRKKTRIVLHASTFSPIDQDLEKNLTAPPGVLLKMVICIGSYRYMQQEPSRTDFPGRTPALLFFLLIDRPRFEWISTVYELQNKKIDFVREVAGENGWRQQLQHCKDNLQKSKGN